MTMHSSDGVSEIEALLTDDEKDALLAERDRRFPPPPDADAPADALGIEDVPWGDDDDFMAGMWDWLTPAHVALVNREARTGEIPAA